MSITVEQAGIADSFQDRGRNGYRALGINPGGAMDPFSLRVANLLTGNDPGESVIELHFPASAFRFHAPALIALAGADFLARAEGRPIPLHQPVFINQGVTLRFEKPLRGARCYLALRGGWETDRWLQSGSTHLQASCGGWKGRCLQLGDRLPFRHSLSLSAIPAQHPVFPFPWGAVLPPDPYGPEELLVLPGQEWKQLTEPARALFTGSPFTIGSRADRMGYRLQNQALERSVKTELLSTAVSPGTLQLLPDGQLILLMADHPSTGGYPRVGHVISSHLYKAAQSRPGQALRFRFCKRETAETLLLKQEDYLRQLQIACNLKLENLFGHAGY